MTEDEIEKVLFERAVETLEGINPDFRQWVSNKVSNSAPLAAAKPYHSDRILFEGSPLALAAFRWKQATLIQGGMK